MTFYERYQFLCKEQGIAPASQTAADALGCSKSNISTLAKTGNTPNGDIVANAAKMLNVSADYLLGLTDEPRPLEMLKALEPEEEMILTKIRKLNGDAMVAVDSMISGLVANPVYKKNED